MKQSRLVGLVVAWAVGGCVTAPQLHLGGRDVLDLADAASGASWEWQQARFTPTGSAEPPTAGGFVPLPTNELTAPRGGDGFSAVWYRVRFPAPTGAAERPLLIAVAVDDYGEIVVNGEVRATTAGFNGVLVAELPPSPQHDVLILGVNSPLGRPPRWPLIRNEVFVRRPVRVVVDGRAPALSRASGGRPLLPRQTCAMRIGDGELHPLIDELGHSACAALGSDGPRWLRYRVDGPTTIEVSGSSYAEVWLDGGIDLAFGENGRAPMSRIGGVQRVPLPDGAHDVDVLAWPAPFTQPASTVDVSLTVVE
jgi:hypothetical protein